MTKRFDLVGLLVYCSIYTAALAIQWQFSKYYHEQKEKEGEEEEEEKEWSRNNGYNFTRFVSLIQCIIFGIHFGYSIYDALAHLHTSSPGITAN